MDIPQGLTYDDVTLVPQYNNVKSRLDPILGSWITKDIKIDIPILASNMDTVICDQLADVLLDAGSIPIFHRYTSFAKQTEWCNKYGDKCFISCGFNKIDETISLLSTGPGGGPKGVCIDVAHGHCKETLDLIRKLKNTFPDKSIIAGNVCTPLGYQDLVNAGADAVKVGVGSGSCCSTRIQTGFGIPMFTAIYEIGKVAKKLRVPIIADGGIVHPKDMCIALAAGASTVMMGNLFAKTNESAGQKIEKNGFLYCHYRGQASEEFQHAHYGGMKKGVVEEGISFDTPCSGPAITLIEKFTGSLRSSLTYGGAKDIKEFQRKVEFLRVSSDASRESHPRPYQ